MKARRPQTLSKAAAKPKKIHKQPKAVRRATNIVNAKNAKEKLWDRRARTCTVLRIYQVIALCCTCCTCGMVLVGRATTTAVGKRLTDHLSQTKPYNPTTALLYRY